MKVIRLESQFTPTELYQAKTQMKSLWFYYLKSELYQDIEKSISISASVFVLWWSELQATESQQDY